jgi:hypothetical protein
MFITTSFVNDYGPANGLSPAIKIRLVEDGSLVVSGTMTPVGDGFYTYDFYSYDITKAYAILCDAISLPNIYRYKFLSTGEYGPIINNVDLLSDDTDALSLLIKKILINRLELEDGDTQNWVLYDDDDTTVLLKWNVTDKFDDIILQKAFDVSRRTRGM